MVNAMPSEVQVMISSFLSDRRTDDTSQALGDREVMPGLGNCPRTHV